MTAPFDFYQASLQLWRQLASGVQAGNQQWLEQAAKVAQQDLSEAQLRMQELALQRNWLALASLPQELAWRASLHQLSAWQEAVQAASHQQPPLAEGVQGAALGWQQEAFKSLSQAWGAFGNPAAWLPGSTVCRP